MLAQCLAALDLQPDGRYVDVTFGGGGHSARILEKLTTGHLYSFDQDADAEAEAEKLARPQFTFVKANFRDLAAELQRAWCLARGWPAGRPGRELAPVRYARAGLLDPLRRPAGHAHGPRRPAHGRRHPQRLQGSRPAPHLRHVRRGDQRPHPGRTPWAPARRGRRLETIAELKQAIQPCTPRGKENKYLAQVFQALRIEVNQEMQALQEMLLQTAEVLRPGGRLVVLSYHSLEDRLVKNFIAQGQIFRKRRKRLLRQ